MRTCLLVFLFLLLAGGAARAQDVLTKRNGEELKVKVVEITPSEVKFRRADNLDGPLISVWRTDVFMIVYANGVKEVLNAATIFQTTGPPSPPAAVRAAFPGEVPKVGNEDPNDAVLEEPIRLDGPRVGVTFLSSGVRSKALEEGVEVGAVITQFGWQFESRLFRLPNGVSGLVEFVPLVGGLEQGRFLPSINGLLGIRGAKGFEFGVGPNVTPLGASLVLAMGTSIRSYGVNFPVNLAVVPGRDGMRVSLLVGFNARHR
ncbi:hypothetical protein MUN81_03120 [Hymenobacter sp. 5317J-9]|uniref:hypothetical protein n=1 Tax=Hymenobacter sp. 5317J-9 TaxID=2932250 RepID=UPI001FD698EB|nr:hypothetical protein [Hymenobacter sp. 5317J-9]UOQ98486.1 hypothetical protein MUN81_03120 [Hymenobacter sp. 5317J-9]